MINLSMYDEPSKITMAFCIVGLDIALITVALIDIKEERELKREILKHEALEKEKRE